MWKRYSLSLGSVSNKQIQKAESAFRLVSAGVENKRPIAYTSHNVTRLYYGETDVYMPENHARRVERISKAKFDRFRAVYHAPPDAYWKGDRIYEALEKWKILSAARTRRLLLPRL